MFAGECKFDNTAHVSVPVGLYMDVEETILALAQYALGQHMVP